MYRAVAQVGAGAAPLAPLASPAVRISSYVLMGSALLLLLWQGLLPGLLFACLGFALTRWLAHQLAQIPRDSHSSAPLPRWTQSWRPRAAPTPRWIVWRAHCRCAWTP